MLTLKIQESLQWTKDEGVYGNYSSKSYAKHRSAWSRDGFLTVYYSYTTIVAFKDGDGFHVCQNDWSCTTGKHLNWLCPDKKSRLPRTDFIQLLKQAEDVNEVMRKFFRALTGDEPSHDF